MGEVKSLDRNQSTLSQESHGAGTRARKAEGDVTDKETHPQGRHDTAEENIPGGEWEGREKQYGRG
jgi:hypothetical protein